MSIESIKPNAVDLHDELAKDWEQKYAQPRFQRRSAHFLKLIQDLPIARQVWLDGGCGTGFLSRRLLARGCKIIGMDASKDMLHVAQGLSSDDEKASSLFCRIGTIESLPLPDASFDGVVCSSVIEYLDNPNACLAELSRVLKPGGILLISAPNRQSLLRCCLKLAYSSSRLLLAKPWPKYLSYSINEYSHAELIQSLERCGLEVQQMEYYSPVESDLIPQMWIGSLLIGMAVKPRA
ncbi:MAG: methyltransferase domain-containing protein, partial [Methylococcaceae bacterium]|nr:methyltransferase domain-containing protein [Methylococcaceae bacterium]